MMIIELLAFFIILGLITGGKDKRKTGTWIRKTHNLRADEYICSVCGRSVPKTRRTCPYCGAEMRKTNYEASWVDEAEMMSALCDDDW